MCTSPVLAQQATQDDSNGTAVAQSGNPFSDVPANSWAYQAVKALAADGLVEGYPNGKFEGNRPMTRYEMAVLINRAVDKMEAQIAAGQKQNAADIATLKKLVDAFGAELKAVQDHVAALDTKVAAIDAAERADATLLKRQQFHLYSFLRAPGSYNDATSAFAGPAGITTAEGGIANVPAGGGLPGQTRLVNNDSLGSPGGVAGQNANYTGAQTYGTAYMVNRLLFTGDVDPNVSYVFRLENRYYMETPNYGAPAATTGNSGSAPFYCTSLTAQAAPLPASAT
ncbi:MAG TPA: S-layer homology domain-containing protein, partial [Candidatus Baltobacteraceae bacterium]|nr:S-layer homology domain-containing protein [Candidatus Baltobacteraceae bacterium]